MLIPPAGSTAMEAVLDALEADHDFLVEGGVFTDDLIDTWLDYKRTKEVDQIRLRPHPWEFMLYTTSNRGSSPLISKGMSDNVEAIPFRVGHSRHR